MSNHTTSILDEQLMSPAEIARMFPPRRAGRPIHATTVTRWIVDGVELPDGTRIRLDGVRCGSHWWSSREALNRFCAAQSVGVQAPQPDSLDSLVAAESLFETAGV
jgi:hypothetical protein